MNPLIQDTKDHSHTLYVPELDETYHSRNGAIAEAEYVYVGRGLEDFLSKYCLAEVSILEIGFGTGLNTLLTLEKIIDSNIPCHYTAIDVNPLPINLIEQLNYAVGEKQKVFLKIHVCDWEIEAPIHTHFELLKQNISIHAFQSTRKYDIIYFDAFAPEKQPDMWQKGVFEKLFDYLNPRGFLVTYSSKGEIKRMWKEIGFEVERLPGPPFKRHMLRGIKPIVI